MFIEFGICNLKLLLLLLYPIGRYGVELVSNSFSPLYNYFITYLSFLLSGLIYLLFSYRSKKFNNTEISINAEINSAINQIEQERKKEKKRKKRNELIYIILLSLLYFLPVCVKLFFDSKFRNNKNNKSFNNNIDDIHAQMIAAVLMFYSYMILSKILLDEKIYKHRLISVIIITICFFMSFIMDEFFTFDFRHIFIFLIYEFTIRDIDALFSVLLKLHFNTYLTDTYLFIFYLGFFTLLILIPFEIIYQIFFNGKTKILGIGAFYQFGLFFNDFLKNLICFILLIIFNLIRHASQIFIIYHFTPSHFLISLMIYSIVVVIKTWVSNVIGKKSFEFTKGFFFFLFNVIIVFFSLIYNEIIIIKLCSLEKYTTKYILKREKEEFEDLDESVDDENKKFRINERETALIEFQDIYDK